MPTVSESLLDLPMDASHLFVLTGGPGAGKTTLIEALRARGFATSVEAGRAIIKDQSSKVGQALPWKHPALFAELMLSWELRSYALLSGEAGPVFFDRGVPDVVGYLKLNGLPVPTHVEAAAWRVRYNRKVFVLPPWPEIYRPDDERRQTWEEAERTYKIMVETYSRLGYELVTLPRAPVADRLRCVMTATEP